MNVDRRPRRGTFFLTLLTLLAATAVSVGARDSLAPTDSLHSFSPVYLPTLTVNEASGGISIDGKLDEPAWKSAARSDRFVERMPGDMSRPAVHTEVLVTYDKDNLYIGFVCHDDPSTLRATMCQRDQYSGDDAVVVLLDTYGNAAWAYEFWVNPYGVQRDVLWTPTIGEDFSYDLIWRSAAQVTADGYRVEIAIPFSSLRFPGGQTQQWKMDFWRTRPRESYYQYSWAAYDRGEECWPCQWGTVRGIEDVEPGKGVELISSVVANQSGSIDATHPDLAFDNADPRGELSIGGKYALSSDVTVEGSYNPDFSQIEADAAQLDVNTTIALMYPERRPFFQEGADIFRTLFNSFYTRTVWDPEYAVKLTGRGDRTSIGFLTARDENSPYTIPLEEGTVTRAFGSSTVNVLRGSMVLGNNSRAGVMVTDRRYDDGGYGTILSLDGNIRLSSNYGIAAQVIQSFTGEPDEAGPTAGLEGLTFDRGKHTAVFDGESYSGMAYIAQLRRRGRHLSVTLSSDQVAPSYRTQTGYDPWNNYRNGYFDASYTVYSDRSIFERITPQVHIDRRWNFDGDIKWTHVYSALNANLRVWQTRATVSYQTGSESWGGLEFDKLWRAAAEINSRPTNSINLHLAGHRARSVALWVPTTGNEYGFNAACEIKPIDRFVVEPSLSYVRSTDVDDDSELFEQLITRTRVGLQATRELSLRLVVQFDDFRQRWEVDPLVTYRLSSFSVFYIGSTYDYENVNAGTPLGTDYRMSSRKFFMKIQYLFQT